MRIFKYFAPAMAAVILASCKHHDKDLSADVPQRTVFFDKSGMDTTVKAGDNFFLYANGLWTKKTQIPASERGWGSFYKLYDDNLKNLNRILKDVSSKEHEKGSLEQKVGDLYESGMDTAAIEKTGYEPIKPQLEKVKLVKGL